ncbi:hypothetical protein RDV78_00615 [Bacillota bacterium LX-D]|nr:hypothetical protein [Bacillota bacterium LX-D]
MDEEYKEEQRIEQQEQRIEQQEQRIEQQEQRIEQQEQRIEQQEQRIEQQEQRIEQQEQRIEQQEQRIEQQEQSTTPIRPGVCPPRGCPPPTRIECVSVDKVYDSCFQVHSVTRTVSIPLCGASPSPIMPPFDSLTDTASEEAEVPRARPDGQNITSTAGANAAVRSMSGPFTIGTVIPCSLRQPITCQEIARRAVGGGFFSITLLITLPMTLSSPFTNNPAEVFNQTFTFTKTVTLCCPPGVNPDCSESTITTCNCIVTDIRDASAKEMEVTCEVEVCLVVKCIQRVELLVPSYGFCVPAPCVTLPGACPPTAPPQCF